MIMFFTSIGRWLYTSKTGRYILGIGGAVIAILTIDFLRRKDAVDDYKDTLEKREDNALEKQETKADEQISKADEARRKHGHYPDADSVPDDLAKHIFRD